LKYFDFYKEKLLPYQNFIQLGKKNSFGGGFCIAKGLQ